MPTPQMYRYAFKEHNLEHGVQTLHGSPDLPATDPVRVGHARQLLMDRHVVDDLNSARRTVHQPRKREANPILSAPEAWEASGPCSYGTVMRDPRTGLFRLWTPIDDIRRKRPEVAPRRRYTGSATRSGRRFRRLHRPATARSTGVSPPP